MAGGVNEVADGFIPDLAEGDEYGEIVYRWYRSGVLTGDASTASTERAASPGLRPL